MRGDKTWDAGSGLTLDVMLGGVGVPANDVVVLDDPIVVDEPTIVEPTSDEPRVVQGRAAAGPRYRSEEEDYTSLPHVRLGLLWAIATVYAVSKGEAVFGIWMAAHLVPVFTQLRSLLVRQRVSYPSAAVAAILSVGTVAGLIAAYDFGATGAAPVLAMVWLMFAYDAGSYLLGVEARTRWEGPAAGIAAIMATTITIAALLNPPFSDVRPWIVGGIAAVSGPMGPALADRLLGTDRRRGRALRRLDAGFVMIPALLVYYFSAIA